MEVKNIQYILATLLYPSVKLRQIEQKIPSGMNMILKISLHDNLGNEFSHNIEDVNGIKYELSHKDVVDVQIGNNLTVSVSTLYFPNIYIEMFLILYSSVSSFPENCFPLYFRHHFSLVVMRIGNNLKLCVVCTICFS